MAEPETAEMDQSSMNIIRHMIDLSSMEKHKSSQPESIDAYQSHTTPIDTQVTGTIASGREEFITEKQGHDIAGGHKSLAVSTNKDDSLINDSVEQKQDSIMQSDIQADYNIN